MAKAGLHGFEAVQEDLIPLSDLAHQWRQTENPITIAAGRRLEAFFGIEQRGLPHRLSKRFSQLPIGVGLDSVRQNHEQPISVMGETLLIEATQ